MIIGQSKILTNVLLCVDDNHLQLCDVIFNRTIDRILLHPLPPVSWKQIASEAGWQEYKSSVNPPSRPADSGHFDGGYRLLIPGAIDAHVHFNTPGFEVREDFEHGSAAAASGGVTTVIDMPCTSRPPVTSLKNLQTKLAQISQRSVVDYALWGGISRGDFFTCKNPGNIIQELGMAGVAGFKAYLVSGMESFSDLSYPQILKAAEWVVKTGKPLAVHAEDKFLVRDRERKLRRAGKQNWQAYCSSRDVLAETTAVSHLLDISQHTGCRIHIVHLSSGGGVQLIQEARERNIPLTAETCPHYLHFTQLDFDNPAISRYLKTAPPVKSKEDQDQLWSALESGLLQFVTTDHAGCDPLREKSSANFWEVYGGIPGVENRVPFLFSEGFKKGRLGLQKTIDLLAKNPAIFFRMDSRKGELKPGKDADFALIDLWVEHKISAEDMHSKGKYTPFAGITFSAKVKQTFLRGQPLLDEKGSVIKNFGYGQWIEV